MGGSAFLTNNLFVGVLDFINFRFVGGLLLRINILFVETSVCSKIEFLITLHSTLEIYIKCSILSRREIHGISQEVTGVIIGPGLNQPKNYLYIIMEEFRRRIFLLNYGNPSKSEAFYPKIKIL